MACSSASIAAVLLLVAPLTALVVCRKSACSSCMNRNACWSQPSRSNLLVSVPKLPGGACLLTSCAFLKKSEQRRLRHVKRRTCRSRACPVAM